MSKRLLPFLVVLLLLVGTRSAVAQPAAPRLTATAQALTKYLPSQSQLPTGVRQRTELEENTNEELVAQPGNADLAGVVVSSRRMTEVGFIAAGANGLPEYDIFVGAFTDAAGACSYVRDFTFAFFFEVTRTAPGPAVGECSAVYRFSSGTGPNQLDILYLTFQRDRLQAEVLLVARAGEALLEDALPVARAIDEKIQASPPAAPTEADMALVEQPTPAVIVRGAARLIQARFVESLTLGELLADAWAGATRALNRAGVTNVPPAPAYPSDDEAAVALHMRSFPMLETLAAGAVSSRDLAYAAIREMTSRRNDCHTRFETPEIWERTKAQSLGGPVLLFGFGSEKETADAPWIVTSITPNSPAKAAGLRRGQEILAINGQSVAGLTFDEARALLDTREGLAHTFTVRNPSGRVQDLVIAPARFTIPALESEVLPGGIGLIRFYDFQITDRQVQLMRDALEDFEQQGVTGWLIDMRNNGGGTDATVRTMTSLFVEGGRLYGTITRTRREPQFNSATGNALPFQRPLVILVGPGSGSGGEIMPGALQARGRAVLVGETTAGCIGSFLIGTGLLDGSVVDVTTTEIVIGPDGARFHRRGVPPNVEVPAPTPEEDEAGIDPQLDRAIDVLKELTGPETEAAPTPAQPPMKAAVVWS